MIEGPDHTSHNAKLSPIRSGIFVVVIHWKCVERTGFTPWNGQILAKRSPGYAEALEQQDQAT